MKDRWYKQGDFAFDGKYFEMRMDDEEGEAARGLYVEYTERTSKNSVRVFGRAAEMTICISFKTANKELARRVHTYCDSKCHNPDKYYDPENGSLDYCVELDESECTNHEKSYAVRFGISRKYPKNILTFLNSINTVYPEFDKEIINDLIKTIGLEEQVKEIQKDTIIAPKRDGLFGEEVKSPETEVYKSESPRP